jgi:hypothetical protein
MYWIELRLRKKVAEAEENIRDAQDLPTFLSEKRSSGSAKNRLAFPDFNQYRLLRPSRFA